MMAVRLVAMVALMSLCLPDATRTGTTTSPVRRKEFSSSILKFKFASPCCLILRGGSSYFAMEDWIPPDASTGDTLTVSRSEHVHLASCSTLQNHAGRTDLGSKEEKRNTTMDNPKIAHHITSISSCSQNSDVNDNKEFGCMKDEDFEEVAAIRLEEGTKSEEIQESSQSATIKRKRSASEMSLPSVPSCVRSPPLKNRATANDTEVDGTVTLPNTAFELDHPVSGKLSAADEIVPSRLTDQQHIESGGDVNMHDEQSPLKPPTDATTDTTSLLEMDQHNDTVAMYQLGINAMSQPGRSGAAEAVSWWQKAANAGHVDAMFNMGICCLQGVGVAGGCNETAAAYWFEMASLKGDADAQFNMAVCCLEGWGTNRHRKKAAKWLRMAARSGDTQSAVLLATLLGTAEADKPAGENKRTVPNERNGNSVPVNETVGRGGDKEVVKRKYTPRTPKAPPAPPEAKSFSPSTPVQASDPKVVPRTEQNALAGKESKAQLGSSDAKTPISREFKTPATSDRKKKPHTLPDSKQPFTREPKAASRGRVKTPSPSASPKSSSVSPKRASVSPKRGSRTAQDSVSERSITPIPSPRTKRRISVVTSAGGTTLQPQDNGKDKGKEKDSVAKDSSEWNVDQVCAKLSDAGLERYVDAFRESCIDGSMLDELEELWEEPLGVTNKAHKIKILKVLGKR